MASYNPGDAFGSGLDMGLKIANFIGDKEKDELLMEKTRLEMEQSKQIFEREIKKSDLDIDYKIQQNKLNDIELAYAPQLTKTKLAYQEGLADNIQERNNLLRAQTEGVISENKRNMLSTDTAVFSQVGEILATAQTNTEFNTGLELFSLIENPVLRNTIINAGKLETNIAFKNLDPVFQSGDFSNLPATFAKDFTTIMKPQTDTLVGSKFIDNQGRSGTVQGISMNGAIIGKGRGDQAVVGAKVNVRFSDGETKEFDTFIPDRPEGQDIRVFREDLQADDSKAVSVSDLTDYISSQRTLEQNKLQSPVLANNLIKLSKSLKDIYDPSSSALNKEDQITRRAVFGARNTQYNVLLAGIDVQNLLDKGVDDPQMQSALGLFYSAYGKNSGIEKDGDSYKPSQKYDTPLQAIFSNSPDILDPLSVEGGGSVQEITGRWSNQDIKDGKPIVTVQGMNFAFDEDIESIKNALLTKFGDNPYMQRAVENFHQYFVSNAANMNVPESEYADRMQEYLLEELKQQR